MSQQQCSSPRRHSTETVKMSSRHLDSAPMTPGRRSKSTNSQAPSSVRLQQQMKQQLLQATSHHGGATDDEEDAKVSNQKVTLQSMDVSVSVLRGEALAPKDRNWKGEATSSDPYVIVKLLSSSSTQEVVLGKTDTVMDSLNPVWDEDEEPMEVTLGSLKPGNQYSLQFAIMDQDIASSDDLMGVVTVPLDMTQPVNSTEWYEVPADSANNATGRILLALQTKLCYNDGSMATAEATRKPKPQLPAPTTVAHKKESSYDEASSLDLEKDVEILELDLTVIKGDGLAAKDRNIIGQRTTSDPYIEVTLLPGGHNSIRDQRELSLGLTRTILKTLSPEWNDRFTTSVPLSTLTDNAQLRLTIQDYDEFTQDDCMGIVHIHIPLTQKSSVTEKWYGVPASSAPNASGRIQCSLTTQRRFIAGLNAQHDVVVEGETVSKTTNTTTITKTTTTATAPRSDTIDTMNIAVTVLAGAGLAAKDRNFVGKRTSSDPYVVVKLLTAPPGAPNEVKEIEMGKTEVVPQSLAPVWNERFETSLQGPDLVRVNEARIQLTVYDRDLVTNDDCMGVLTIPLPLLNTAAAGPRWYGIPSHSAKNASGRLQVQLDTTIAYASDRLRRSKSWEPSATVASTKGSNPSMTRASSTRKFKSTAQSRDTSAFCTPRRTRRTQKKVKGTPIVTTPLFLENSEKLKEEASRSNETKDTQGRAPSPQDTSSDMPTSKTTTESTDTTDGAVGKDRNCKMLDLTQSKNCKISRFAQQKKAAPSREMAAFCTPKRTKPKSTVKLPAMPKCNLTASPSSPEDKREKASTPKSSAKEKLASSTKKTSPSSSIYCTPSRSDRNRKLKNKPSPDAIATPLAGEDPPATVIIPSPTTISKQPKLETDSRTNSPAEQDTVSPRKTIKKAVSFDQNATKTNGKTAPFLRPPSKTWHCTCGHESEKTRRFCGICGVKQSWTCEHCNYGDNICLFKFCGMCGVQKSGTNKSTRASNDIASPISVRAF